MLFNLFILSLIVMTSAYRNSYGNGYGNYDGNYEEDNNNNGQTNSQSNTGQINEDNDSFVFDEELPSDFNQNRIGYDPVKYSPHHYHKKYFQDTSNAEFSYDYNSPRAPPLWPRTFRQCGGRRQSPMNLDINRCITRSETRRLGGMRSEIEPEIVTMENNGYSVEFSFEYTGQRPLLQGGPLRSTYIFEQIHFHWGMRQGEGSEHTIDSQRSDLEMHVVHRNARYPNMTVAAQNRDGIVVVGILFEESPQADDLPMLRNIDQLSRMNSSVNIEGRPSGFRMMDILGSMNDPFIAYQGSLTTPPCSEAVSWFVGRIIREISPRDMNNFRRLLGMDGERIAPNFRPLQQTNDRQCLVF